MGSEHVSWGITVVDPKQDIGSREPELGSWVGQVVVALLRTELEICWCMSFPLAFIETLLCAQPWTQLSANITTFLATTTLYFKIAKKKFPHFTNKETAAQITEVKGSVS